MLNLDLETIWYLVIFFSVVCYAMLDGFDLGVGMVHPFAKKDVERRLFLNAIGPVWDGNEVWIVIIGGALFAGFPEVFATVFSAFYIPTMVLLCGLIFRAVSIEFRSKRQSVLWRRTWDATFSIGSYVIAFGVGVVLGNLIEGLPLNATHDFVGTFSVFLRPYSLLVGVVAVALFMTHGVIYLVMKTEGEIHDSLRRWTPRCITFFIVSYLVLSGVTFFSKPFMVQPMLHHPILFIIPFIGFLAILSVPYLMRKRRDGWAFLSSCLSIALLLSLFAIGTYPHLVRSTIDPETNSLVISNSASSPLTLKVLLIIVIIGVPMVLGYGFYIYRIFRGKVKLEATSY